MPPTAVKLTDSKRKKRLCGGNSEPLILELRQAHLIRKPFFFKIYLLIYFCLYRVFIATRRLSLVVASRCCSPAVVGRLLFVAASLVAQCGLEGASTSVTVSCGLRRCGLRAQWHVGSSQTRDRTHVPCIGSGLSTNGPPGKPQKAFSKNKPHFFKADNFVDAFPVKKQKLAKANFMQFLVDVMRVRRCQKLSELTDFQSRKFTHPKFSGKLGIPINILEKFVTKYSRNTYALIK